MHVDLLDVVSIYGSNKYPYMVLIPYMVVCHYHIWCLTDHHHIKLEPFYVLSINLNLMIYFDVFVQKMSKQTG